MTSRSLQGLVVAVTGGARGIGREIAVQLSVGGARVAIGDLDQEAAAQTAAGLAGEAEGFALDVGDSASFSAFLASVEADLGPIDVLVNNAGVMWVGSFADEPEAATARQLNVNLHGVIRGVKLAAPAMRRRGSGHIVTIASAASKLAPAGEATYAASKHGVHGYLSGVRAELRGSGVQLSIIMPIVVDTELALGTSSGAARLLTPSDVAEAVVSVIRRPRFELTVPGYIDLLVRLVNVLPRFGRDFVMRRLVPDQIEGSTGRPSRADYQSRHLGEEPPPRPVDRTSPPPNGMSERLLGR